ncbi:VOC family protein [Streptococcus sanguinis]|uniref:VOC family protein n=1 Tax=Streptococcus sanguinis TaxID=1305 RepID=UPI001D13E764|nr:VOC family protein [Streptococcus sanguinis]MCC3172852.1 glyoxalase-like domain protein [Streptococcus sanguinis]
MKIEHVGLYVRDLEGARQFFQDYFQAASNSLYHNPKTGFSSYFLTFASGARLEIMTREHDLADAKEDLYQTGYHHLAFALGSQEEVDRLTARLERDGYPVLSGPRVTGDGYYESLLKAFENLQIELTV